MTKQTKRKAAVAESVDAFLKSNRDDPNWRGGRRCRTCSHQNADQINAELRVFAKAKQNGHEMPWSRFFRDRLLKVYGLKCADTALMRHVRDCMEPA
jgi:hypothetical protein